MVWTRVQLLIKFMKLWFSYLHPKMNDVLVKQIKTKDLVKQQHFHNQYLSCKHTVDSVNFHHFRWGRCPVSVSFSARRVLSLRARRTFTWLPLRVTDLHSSPSQNPLWVRSTSRHRCRSLVSGFGTEDMWPKTSGSPSAAEWFRSPREPMRERLGNCCGLWVADGWVRGPRPQEVRPAPTRTWSSDPDLGPRPVRVQSARCCHMENQSWLY